MKNNNHPMSRSFIVTNDSTNREQHAIKIDPRIPLPIVVTDTVIEDAMNYVPLKKQHRPKWKSVPDSETSQSKRQKIELAISELNIDEDLLHDLKIAFDCKSLESVKETNSTKHENSVERVSFIQSNKNRGFHFEPPKREYHKTYSPNAYPINYPPPHAYVHPYTPYATIPRVPYYLPPRYPSPSQIQTIREVSSIDTKLQESNESWQIVIFAPQFKMEHLHCVLVYQPIKEQDDIYPNALMIDAVKITIKNSKENGTITQKTTTCQKIVPLKNRTVPGPISVQQLASGLFKVIVGKKVSE